MKINSFKNIRLGDQLAWKILLPQNLGHANSSTVQCTSQSLCAKWQNKLLSASVIKRSRTPSLTCLAQPCGGNYQYGVSSL